MKLIEFIGQARAGKTTQINRLHDFLVSQGKSVAVLTDRERAQSLATPPSEGLAYLLTFFSAVIEFTCAHRDADYVLVDRGFVDVAVWADVHRAMGDMTSDEADAVKKCFARFAKTVDATFFFTVPVDVALTRHESSGEHHAVDDVAMNRKWLDVLADAYAKNAVESPNYRKIDGLQSADEAERVIRDAVLSL